MEPKAPTHIFVTAAAGREVPIPSTDGYAPGGSLLRVLPGKVYRLPISQFTRKRLKLGDLELVTRDLKPAKSVEEASAPSGDLDFDETGAVVGPSPTVASVAKEKA